VVRSSIDLRLSALRAACAPEISSAVSSNSSVLSPKEHKLGRSNSQFRCWSMPVHETDGAENIVSGVFTPLLAKDSKRNLLFARQTTQLAPLCASPSFYGNENATSFFGKIPSNSVPRPASDGPPAATTTYCLPSLPR